MRVLVAGMGNVFLGDDGFGVEVVRRLRDGAPIADVDVADFGIRGVHLAYELAGGGYDAAILVDATARGGSPGTLYVIEPDVPTTDEAAAADAHTLTPEAVLAWVQRVGALPARLVILGCEPAILEESMEMSPQVRGAIDEAVAMVRGLVVDMKGALPCV
jgi:hydrogenase maturation protease